MDWQHGNTGYWEYTSYGTACWYQACAKVNKISETETTYTVRLEGSTYFYNYSGSWNHTIYRNGTCVMNLGNAYPNSVPGYAASGGGYSYEDITITKGTSAQTKSYSCTTQYIVSWSTGSLSTATVSITVPALSSYSVTLSKGTGVGTVYYRKGTSGSWSTYSSAFTAQYSTTVQAYSTASAGYKATYTSSSPLSWTMGSGAVTKTLTASPITYYVRFNGNGSTSGSMSNMTCKYGKTYNLTANAFSRTGHTFAGWSETQGGSATIADQQAFANWTTTAGAIADIWAVWNVNSYTVTLSKGTGVGTIYYRIGTSGSWTTYSSAFSANYGATVQAYSTASTGYTPTYTSSSPLSWTMGAATTTKTLTATANTITITLDKNGGTGGTNYIYFKYGTNTYYSDSACTSVITTYSMPTKAGYIFQHYAGSGQHGGSAGERYLYGYSGGTPGSFASDLCTDIYANDTFTAIWESYKMNVKVNGSWVGAKTYVKVNGSWVLAKVWVKVNGTWVRTK